MLVEEEAKSGLTKEFITENGKVIGRNYKGITIGAVSGHIVGNRCWDKATCKEILTVEKVEEP